MDTQKITHENLEEHLGEIMDFYNSHFPMAQHEPRYKRHMYKKPDNESIVLFIESHGKVIGLLESWLKPKRPDLRLLTTLAIDPRFRKQGLARKLIEEMFAQSFSEKISGSVVVNYRVRNRTSLEPFYEKFGFQNPILIGSYANGDDMWEMRREKECPE